MDHRKLGLRVYATAATYSDALGLAERLIGHLSPLVAVRECRVYPYPKFDACFGLWLELSAPDQGSAFDRVQELVAPHWGTHGAPGDRSAIWNQPTDGGVAVLPEATWIHLNLWSDPDED
ncbi:hypothetical protein [Brevundimonas sp.]|uniref:hypothetical protein n=1 Tax=Brevundimonas sp. TaxID=1871086 RepID=UPI002D6FCFC0|nr:hypothetical protein [Brevundimonas sp.]HYC69046.1 hypothetical protein [Brevundimonas sp.]